MDRSHNNLSTETYGGVLELNSSSAKKKEGATAGFLIDNFCSEPSASTIDINANSSSELSRLQAKIWSLQSENELLNSKMEDMIQINATKDYQLRAIN